MAVVASELGSSSPREEFPLLENGDHLDQKTFHALYEQTPEGFRAELIGGVVFVASPVRYRHRGGTFYVSNWLGAYQQHTPGVEGLGEGTVILGPEDEPEPDATLSILPEYGGRSYEEAGYQAGAPELVVEVSLSSVSIDLTRKKQQYELAGVDEYVVFVERSREVKWFVNAESGFRPLPADEDGLFRSRRFPGLWLNAAAFWNRDLHGLAAAVEAGCSTPEHAAFVAELEAARQKAE